MRRFNLVLSIMALSLSIGAGSAFASDDADPGPVPVNPREVQGPVYDNDDRCQPDARVYTPGCGIPVFATYTDCMVLETQPHPSESVYSARAQVYLIAPDGWKYAYFPYEIRSDYNTVQDAIRYIQATNPPGTCSRIIRGVLPNRPVPFYFSQPNWYQTYGYYTYNPGAGGFARYYIPPRVAPRPYGGGNNYVGGAPGWHANGGGGTVAVPPGMMRRR